MTTSEKRATTSIDTIGHAGGSGKSTVVKAVPGIVNTVLLRNKLKTNLAKEKLSEIYGCPKSLSQYENIENAENAKLLRLRNGNGRLKRLSTIKPLLRRCLRPSTMRNRYSYSLKYFKRPRIPEDLCSNNKKTILQKKQKIYYAQKIVGITVKGSKPMFKVQWLGYNKNNTTWEPYEHVMNCIAFANFIAENIVENNYDIMKIEHEIENRLKLNGFILKHSALDIEEIDKFDINILFIDLILLLKSTLTTKIRNAIYKRVEINIMMKDQYRMRCEQLKELDLWKTAINKVEINSKLNVENNVDLEYIPLRTFHYIIKNILFQNVTFESVQPIGCHCINGCNPNSNCCPKLVPCISSTQPEFAYHPNKRLRLIKSRAIYECNDACSCGPECRNRVVQFGRNNSLCIFRTSNGRGWGVKTEKHISKGEYICQYTGEIITDKVANERGKVYDSQKQSYLFDLDYYESEDKPNQYTIDATNYGNFARFINHSCEPNSCIYPVWTNCLNKFLPHLALFAANAIMANTEITFDYLSKNDENVEFNTSTIGKIECRCGSKQCRKFLF